MGTYLEMYGINTKVSRGQKILVHSLCKNKNILEQFFLYVFNVESLENCEFCKKKKVWTDFYAFFDVEQGASTKKLKVIFPDFSIFFFSFWDVILCPTYWNFSENPFFLKIKFYKLSNKPYHFNSGQNKKWA